MSAQPAIYVLDANLLLRLVAKNHPHHAVARAATKSLRAGGAELRTLPQSLFEFWVVATREVKVNGLGLSAQNAGKLLEILTRLYPPLPDDAALVAVWSNLVVQNGIVGKHAHDSRYIAAMQAHGLTRFLTFDTGFNRYAALGLEIVAPSSALSPAAEAKNGN